LSGCAGDDRRTAVQVVRSNDTDEVVARAINLLIARGAAYGNCRNQAPTAAISVKRFCKAFIIAKPGTLAAKEEMSSDSRSVLACVVIVVVAFTLGVGLWLAGWQWPNC
jgi:phosphate/sulfate permease